MNRSDYYERLKVFARKVRATHGLTTPRVLRADLRRIYRAEGIHAVLWPYKLHNLNGAYFFDEVGATVMLRKALPPEPMIFTMAHELKHHFCDRDLGYSFCEVTGELSYLEIGAELFAAELIFPEGDFITIARSFGIRPGQCTPEQLVRLKHSTKTTMHYASLVKRCLFLGFASASAFSKVRWRQLEDSLLGVAFHRRKIAHRADD